MNRTSKLVSFIAKTKKSRWILLPVIILAIAFPCVGRADDLGEKWVYFMLEKTGTTLFKCPSASAVGRQWCAKTASPNALSGLWDIFQTDKAAPVLVSATTPWSLNEAGDMMTKGYDCRQCEGVFITAITRDGLVIVKFLADKDVP